MMLEIMLVLYLLLLFASAINMIEKRGKVVIFEEHAKDYALLVYILFAGTFAIAFTKELGNRLLLIWLIFDVLIGIVSVFSNYEKESVIISNKAFIISFVTSMVSCIVILYMLI